MSLSSISYHTKYLVNSLHSHWHTRGSFQLCNVDYKGKCFFLYDLKSELGSLEPAAAWVRSYAMCVSVCVCVCMCLCVCVCACVCVCVYVMCVNSDITGIVVE